MLKQLEAKEQTKEKLEQLLTKEARSRALRDHHAYRAPRPCGMTVHPGFGCTNSCLYCYVADMTAKKPSSEGAWPIVNRLSGTEMAYALASNPHFLPSVMGTFIAMGAVCDPLHEKLVGKTLEYLEAFNRFLGNPTQLSTKMRVSPELAEELAERSPRLSPLVTIITLKHASKLEPRAPPPTERLETISSFRRAGLRPMLFLRPIIPGLTDGEVDEVLSAARKAGAVGVVVGALRASEQIIGRLRSAGVQTDEIERRLGRRRLGKGLVSVPSGDLKREALRLARRRGLIPFASACCANAYTSGVPCTGLCWLRGFCTKCPNKCWTKLPKVDEEEVRQAVRRLLKLEPTSIQISKDEILIRLPRKVGKAEARIARVVMEVSARRLVRLQQP